MATEVQIKAPKFEYATFTIKGTAPYVQNKFSEKARQMIKNQQEAGSPARNKKKREPKNFQECYEKALHVSDDGWYGIPAPAFRNAMISACRTVGFKMTLAKLSVFVEADGFDADDATPLVKITKGKPEYFESVMHIQQTIDIRPRPKWSPGWEAEVRIRYDADQFTVEDVTNLMVRVGKQVGIGEGRPDSKSSAGVCWGLFEVINE